MMESLCLVSILASVAYVVGYAVGQHEAYRIVEERSWGLVGRPQKEGKNDT